MTGLGPWVNDPALDPELRAALVATQNATPPDLDYDAVLTKLRAAIATGGGHGSSGAGTGSVGVSSGAVGVVIAGIVIVGVLVAVLAWERAASTRPREAAPTAPHHAAVVPTPAVASGPAASDDTDVRSPEPLRPQASVAAEPPLAPARVDTRHRTGTRAPSVVAPAADAPGNALAREMQQIREARAALARDPARALQLADSGDREFRDGMFGEERAAMRIIALHALHRDDEARRLGATFLASHHDGLLADRVRRAIATPGSP